VLAKPLKNKEIGVVCFNAGISMSGPFAEYEP